MAIPIPNSSTGGYLLPDPNAPPPETPALNDDALEDLFHDVIVGIVALDDTLVVPRFQQEPPNEPPVDTDWVAFGVSSSKRDFDRSETFEPEHYGADAGALITGQDQELELFISFFGPNAGALQGQFEDGVKLTQNRAALDAQGIKFMGAQGDAYRLPALLKQKYRNRWDQKFKFRRRVNRTYAVLSIVSAAVESLDNEQYLTTIEVNPPT